MTGPMSFDQLPTFAQQRRVRAVADGVPFNAPPAKTVPVIAELPGPVDLPALTEALRVFAARHALLRHRFARRGDRITLRPVGDRSAELDCAVIEESALRTEVDRPFDVLAWPLLRAGIVQRERPLFYLAADHLVSDGGSVVLALREIEAAYRALLAGKPVDLAPPGDFLGYARKQRSRYADGPAFAGEVGELLAQLGDRPVEPIFPIDAGAWDGGTGRYAEQELLDADGIAALMRQCRDTRTTPFMAVLAAFGVAVRELTGRPETGILVATHNRDEPEDEAGFGWYANMLSLYFPTGDRSGFTASVREVRARLMTLLPFYALPLCRVLDANPAHDGVGEVVPTCFMSFVDNRGAGDDETRWRQLDYAPAFRMGYGMWVVQRESGLRMVTASPRPIGGDAPLVELEQRIADVLRESVR